MYVSVDPMRVLYSRDILGSDYIIDASHTKPTMEEIAYFHREAKWKTIGILNGVVSHTPLCPRYNLVVGSEKWKWLLEHGYTQFIDTKWAAKYGANLNPLPDKAIIGVIPWAVNTDFYCPSDTNDDYFLWFSRPTPYKGLGRAINLAMATGIRLVLAMPMEIAEHKYWGEEYTKQIISARQKGAKIEIVQLPNDSHHHEAKRELYRNAKALLFTIEAHEGFGLVVAEALACGTPVIASNMGAMPEIIKQGHTGYLVNVEDDSIDNWQRAIGWVNEGLIDPRDCRADAVARFDRMVAAKRYIELRERLGRIHQEAL